VKEKERGQVGKRRRRERSRDYKPRDKIGRDWPKI
jgi:hypothetical protein